MTKIGKYQQRFDEKRQTLHKDAMNESPPLQDNSETNKKHVIFMGKDVVCGYAFGSDDVCISITDTHIPQPDFATPPKEVLHLSFHDHVNNYSHQMLGHRLISVEDGRAIFEFIQKHHNSPTIIVHCNHGQSRSKAAALVIAAITGRDVLMAISSGRIIKYNNNGDYGNQRVFDVIVNAHMEHGGK